MEIPLGAEVKCGESTCGRSVYLVINPIKEEITDVVVRSAAPPHTEYLVPLEYVQSADHSEIHLRCTDQDLEKMKPFKETRFVQEELPDLEISSPPFFYWPYVAYGGSVYVPVSHPQIPPEELAMHRGARVEATDGHIGRVDEFSVDPKNDRITHLIMREGLLWNKRDVTIPVSEIDRIEKDTVYLKLSKDDVESLPSIPIKRNYLRL
jgi:sporulation protein YlmC with PRC-barrel domain